MTSACRICDSSNNAKFKVREMMLGLRDTFDYLECLDCGSVQIAELPKNMDKYYPKDTYYSLHPVEDTVPERGLWGFLVRKRNQHLTGSTNVIGAILSKLKPRPDLDLFKLLHIRPQHRILDVGCGSGALLASLAKFGYKHLEGVDPFIEADIVADGLRVRKGSVDKVEGIFDVVMFHHSLEHVSDPVAVLSCAQKLLSRDGLCIVRIPTPSSDAWKIFRTDWVQLDAPRHLVIPSRTGMSIASEKASLRIVQIIDDSTAFQYWGSEQYKKDIPLFSQKSYAVSPAESIFSSKEIKQFERMAAEANSRRCGDSAAFILRTTLPV
jgi:SAM-dependent methyltransferase